MKVRQDRLRLWISSLTLINDVLEISRIESGNVRYNPTVVNISSITDKVLNLKSGLLMNRNLKFEVTRTKTDHPYVRADALWIRMIRISLQDIRFLIPASE